MSNALYRVWKILSTVVTILLVFFALSMVGLRCIGWQVFTVVSGSMEPTYSVGDMIYVKPVEPEEIKAGDVITFVMNENLVVGTHRVTEVEQREEHLYFHTKGDANDMVDAAAVMDQNVLGEPVFAIPFLGYISNWVQRPPGSYIAVAAVAVLLSTVLLSDILGRNRKSRQEEIDEAVAKALAAEKENREKPI